ncbi:hypothetical protein CLOACE_21880 [Clostridium acetireducens DSM 10703]|uniref:Copper amine oxidase-like N-terminal domain-containing protein n=1 Tax=Clostridium acetireducens DSM 10703 TaxID=1121290 RepID=A0A1E8EWH0_9CLOT|nr:stalk domain-containing protein [Clostridium acetireducens]OFI01333.1 hypothetical protein CLOACE_21880 [Clostridium acetireducens DSM 10703]
MIYIIYEACCEYKYGKAMLKVNSNDYKKFLKINKDNNVKVKPFKKDNQIYLPLMHVASTIGAVEVKNNEENYNKILNYMGNLIKIKKNNIVILKRKNIIHYNKISNIKLINGEIMMPINYVNHLFDLNSEYNEITNEVVIK